MPEETTNSTPDGVESTPVQDSSQSNQSIPAASSEPAPVEQSPAPADDFTGIAGNVEVKQEKLFSVPLEEPIVASAIQSPAEKPDNHQQQETSRRKEQALNRLIGVVIVVVIIAFGWWLWKNHGETNLAKNSQDNINITVNPNQEQGTVNIVGQDGKKIVTDGSSVENGLNKIKITAFYGNTTNNPEMLDCSLVYPLERETEKKYDSDIINTVRGLLTPLSDEEKALGWVSAIPSGVFVKKITIEGSTAEAHFNASLGQVGGSCAVAAIRSQITKTLTQFPGINSVVICVEDNCNQEEILQP